MAVISESVKPFGFLLWWMILMSGAASRPFLPPRLEIEGYLDRAPAEVAIDEVIEIRAGKQTRSLLVVSARVPGGLAIHLERGLLEYSVIGPRADVERIFGAEPGTPIRGTFTYYGEGKRLLIIELE
jgi:hypothetical protein